MEKFKSFFFESMHVRAGAPRATRMPELPIPDLVTLILLLFTISVRSSAATQIIDAE